MLQVKKALKRKILSNSFLRDLTCPKLDLPRSGPLHNVYSQYGQEVVIRNMIKLLPTQSSYVFVDIGAHDGVTFSNSRFLDETGVWDGVLIEPNPEVFNVLERNRPGRMCIQAAVADSEGEAEFVKNSGYTQMLSGLATSISFKHMRRIAREQKVFAGNTERISVRTKKLSSICAERNINRIDLLLIDVEGGEMGVLESLDFATVDVSIILVERNQSSKNVWEFLESKGFIRIFQVGADDFYIFKSLILSS
jgi:FkbM family methyltransferase